MCRRVCAGDGLDGDGAFVEVDVASGLVLIGVLDVIFWTGNQYFAKSP